MNLDKMTFDLQRFDNVDAANVKTLAELATLTLDEITTTTTYLIKDDSVISESQNVSVGSSNVIGSVTKLPKTPAGTEGTPATGIGLTVTVTVTGEGANATKSYSMDFVTVTATYSDGTTQTYATEALTPETSGAFEETVTGVEVASASTDVTLTLASGYSIANGTATITDGAVSVKSAGSSSKAVVEAPAKAVVGIGSTDTIDVNGVLYTAADGGSLTIGEQTTKVTLTKISTVAVSAAAETATDDEVAKLTGTTFTLGDNTAVTIAGTKFTGSAATSGGTVQCTAVAKEASGGNAAVLANYTVTGTASKTVSAEVATTADIIINQVTWKAGTAAGTVAVGENDTTVTPGSSGTLAATLSSSATTIGGLTYTGSGKTVTFGASNAITLGDGISAVALATGVTDATKITTPTFTLAVAENTATGVEIGGLTFTGGKAGATDVTGNYGTVQLTSTATEATGSAAAVPAAISLTPNTNATIKVSGAAFTKDKLTYSNSSNATSTEVTFGTSNTYADGTTITAKETEASAVVLDGASITLAAKDDSVTYTGSKAITVTKATSALAITVDSITSADDAVTITATKTTGEAKVGNVTLNEGTMTAYKDKTTVNNGGTASVTLTGANAGTYTIKNTSAASTDGLTITGADGKIADIDIGETFEVTTGGKTTKYKMTANGLYSDDESTQYTTEGTASEETGVSFTVGGTGTTLTKVTGGEIKITADTENGTKFVDSSDVSKILASYTGKTLTGDATNGKDIKKVSITGVTDAVLKDVPVTVEVSLDKASFKFNDGVVTYKTTGTATVSTKDSAVTTTGTVEATITSAKDTPNKVTINSVEFTAADSSSDAGSAVMTYNATDKAWTKGDISANTTLAVKADSETTIDEVKYKGTATFNSTTTVVLAAETTVTDAKYKNVYEIANNTTANSITINGVTVSEGADAAVFVKATATGFAVGTAANSANSSINVIGDSAYNMTVAGDTGNELSGIGAANGVTLSGDGLKSGTVTTDSVGSFTIGKSAYSVTSDTSVVFGISSDGVSVASITDLDGTVVGDFTSEIKVNADANKVQVSGDATIGVVGEGTSVTELTGLGDASKVVSVKSAGGATKAVTDVAGKFAFGNDSKQQVTISGDSSVEFTLDTSAATVTAVSSIASATLGVDSVTSAIAINGGDAVTLGGISKVAELAIDSSGKIAEVKGATAVGGLTGNVTVVEGNTASSIQGVSIGITGDKDGYGVAVVDGKVSEINSVSGGATIVMTQAATLNTDSNGKFTFGTTGYEVAGDTAVQFVVGESAGTVSAINGLEGTVKTTDKEITINGDGVTVGGMDAASVVTYDGGTAGIDAITGLTNNATVTGATSAALNLVGTTSTSVATSLTANGNLFQLLNDSDGVTITGGNVVTGLGANASLIASNAGTYTVNGTALNVAAGDVVRGADGGVTAEIFDPSNAKEIDTLAAASVESLASALGIDTSDYATVANDAVEAAIASGASTADKSVLDGNLRFATSVPSGATSQEVDLSGNTGVKDVTLTTGNQTLKFNNEGGNVAQVGAEAKGTKDIELGGGGDIAIIAKGTKATVNVVAGRGSDSIVSGANASVDVGNGGATKVRAIGGATVTMNNYNAADSKAGVQTTNSDIAAAIGNGNITLENGVIGTSEGKVALNSGSASADVVSSADSGDTEGSTIANLYNNAGKMTKVGFTHNDGGTVDLSAQKANTVIQGNSTGTKKNESTLLGGSGNDVIYAGSGDVIDAGAGANKIVLNQTVSSSAEVGATVQMTSATGRNNIDGFNYGFGDNNDAISLDMTNAKFSIDDTGNLIVKNGRAKSTLLGASADGDTSYAQVLIKDTASGETTKAAVAKEGNVISVSSDEDNFANNYIGDGSGLSFSSYESEVNLNLSDTTATFGGEEVQVSGINNVTLGEADATVFGSSAKETITAGNGNETIWAGAGKDTLNGYSGNADDKSGSITFGFMAGDGKDVINNFGYLTTENAQTADRVWTTGQFEAALSGSDVVLSFSGNKKDSLRLTGMAGKNIQLSENGDLNNVTTVLQVSDTLLTYDGLATKYVATGSNAAVVATSDTATANIWLEDKYVNLSNNTTYTGKITAVNAAAVEGQATLVGNSYNNVITGAQGSSSMWGGDSTSNDTLIGGTEGNMFFYGVTGGNEGNDSISGITEDDTVNLFGIQLSDIDLANTSITNSAISLKFTAGGSLTMANNGQTFMLANDQNQRYTYDKENSEWTKA